MPINTHFEVWYLIVNDETFRGVDAATQKKIQDLALQFENRRWQSAEADQAANEKKLTDNGAEIVSVTPEQIAAMAKKIQAKVWPEILKDIGKDWGEGVLAKIAK
jgi:TRAP-type C4-dicarboxylate transport system substrate-binding protein